MCHSTRTLAAFQQAIPNGCPAKALPPSRRQQIGIEVLAGKQTVSGLARDFQVSRKFVAKQSAIADQALNAAFAPAATDDEVLFHIPVTKNWLRQTALSLVLTCHSSLRGVVQHFRDILDCGISVGKVRHIVQDAVALARGHNHAQDLSRVRVGAHDEIFQARRPVLVGVDALTTYCYLLSQESNRDADTWGVRLLELQERGFAPDSTIADAGPSLRAAQAEVMSGVPCRSDVFHALQEVTEVVTYLENRAYETMTPCTRLNLAIGRQQQQGQRLQRSLVSRRIYAVKKQASAIALADDVALLARWLHYDVLDLVGPTHAERLELFDFICAELQARVPLAPKLGPLVTYLQRQRDNLLAFAAQLDRDFSSLAAAFALPVELVRELFAVQTLPLASSQRWRRDALLRARLGKRYHPLSQALAQVRRRTVRASSLVENLNSRLRSYFFLRRHLGNDYLALLQFFLNHRRFPRSDRPERVGKSPTELLTGQSHPHWLELLGYTRFSRN